MPAAAPAGSGRSAPRSCCGPISAFPSGRLNSHLPYLPPPPGIRDDPRGPAGWGEPPGTDRREGAPMTIPRQGFGIAGLDGLLGGGLIPGTLTVIAGATGAGKTQLGLRWSDAGRAVE